MAGTWVVRMVVGSMARFHGGSDGCERAVRQRLGVGGAFLLGSRNDLPNQVAQPPPHLHGILRHILPHVVVPLRRGAVHHSLGHAVRRSLLEGLHCHVSCIRAGGCMRRDSVWGGLVE